MNLIRIFAFLLCWFACLPAIADHITLSAQWDGGKDGTEGTMQAYAGTCNGAGDPATYRQFNAVRVSSNGEYHLADASDSLPGDVMVAVVSKSMYFTSTFQNQPLRMSISTPACSATPKDSSRSTAEGPNAPSRLAVADSSKNSVKFTPTPT